MPVFIAGSGKTIFWFVIHELLPYKAIDVAAKLRNH